LAGAPFERCRGYFVESFTWLPDTLISWSISWGIHTQSRRVDGHPSSHAAMFLETDFCLSHRPLPLPLPPPPSPPNPVEPFRVEWRPGRIEKRGRRIFPHHDVDSNWHFLFWCISDDTLSEPAWAMVSLALRGILLSACCLLLGPANPASTGPTRTNISDRQTRLPSLDRCIISQKPWFVTSRIPLQSSPPFPSPASA